MGPKLPDRAISWDRHGRARCCASCSYNVRYFGHALRGLATTRASMEGIAARLAALSPLADLICFQEVETRSLRSTVAFKGLPPSWSRLMAALEGAFERRKLAFPYDAFHFRAHSYRFRSTTPLHHRAGGGGEPGTAQGGGPQRPQPARHHPPPRGPAEGHQAEPDLRPREAHHAGWPGAPPLQHPPQPAHPLHPRVLEREGEDGLRLQPAGGGAEAGHLRGGPRRRRAVRGVRDFNSPPASPVYRYLSEEVGWVGAQEALRQIDPASIRGFPTAGFFRLGCTSTISSPATACGGWISSERLHSGRVPSTGCRTTSRSSPGSSRSERSAAAARRFDGTLRASPTGAGTRTWLGWIRSSNVSSEEQGKELVFDAGAAALMRGPGGDVPVLRQQLTAQQIAGVFSELVPEDIRANFPAPGVTHFDYAAPAGRCTSPSSGRRTGSGWWSVPPPPPRKRRRWSSPRRRRSSRTTCTAAARRRRWPSPSLPPSPGPPGAWGW